MIQSKLFIDSFQGFSVGDRVKIKEPSFEYEKDLELEIIGFFRNWDMIRCKNVNVKQSSYVLRPIDIEKIKI